MRHVLWSDRLDHVSSWEDNDMPVIYPSRAAAEADKAPASSDLAEVPVPVHVEGELYFINDKQYTLKELRFHAGR